MAPDSTAALVIAQQPSVALLIRNGLIVLRMPVLVALMKTAATTISVLVDSVVKSSLHRNTKGLWEGFGLIFVSMYEFVSTRMLPELYKSTFLESHAKICSIPCLTEAYLVRLCA